MKNKVWMVILGAVLLVCIVLSIFLMRPQADAAAAEIWSDGELKYTLDLSVDRQVTIISKEGTNTVTVRDGHIAVTKADCPDHYCMERGFCASGTQIVCLPNRLVIKFVGGQTIDGVVG